MLIENIVTMAMNIIIICGENGGKCSAEEIKPRKRRFGRRLAWSFVIVCGQSQVYSCKYMHARTATHKPRKCGSIVHGCQNQSSAFGFDGLIQGTSCSTHTKHKAKHKHRAPILKKRKTKKKKHSRIKTTRRKQWCRMQMKVSSPRGDPIVQQTHEANLVVQIRVVRVEEERRKGRNRQPEVPHNCKWQMTKGRRRRKEKYKNREHFFPYWIFLKGENDGYFSNCTYTSLVSHTSHRTRPNIHLSSK